MMNRVSLLRVGKNFHMSVSRSAMGMSSSEMNIHGEMLDPSWCKEQDGSPPPFSVSARATRLLLEMAQVFL